MQTARNGNTINIIISEGPPDSVVDSPRLASDGTALGKLIEEGINDEPGLAIELVEPEPALFVGNGLPKMAEPPATTDGAEFT